MYVPSSTSLVRSLLDSWRPTVLPRLLTSTQVFYCSSLAYRQQRISSLDHHTSITISLAYWQQRISSLDHHMSITITSISLAYWQQRISSLDHHTQGRLTRLTCPHVCVCVFVFAPIALPRGGP